jgi:hypothetical protein
MTATMNGVTLVTMVTTFLDWSLAVLPLKVMTTMTT